MSSIVLVPGAWIGEWAWDRVTPILETGGHKTYPITLPGLCRRANELSPEIGLLAHVNDLLRTCESLKLREAVVVGHSYAGAVVGAAVRRSPELFKAQVYVDTLPLDEGKCFLDAYSEKGKKRFQEQLIIEKGTKVWPMPEPLSSQAPTEGLSEEDLNLLRAKGTPHPARTFEEKLSGTIAKGPHPRNYAISCVENEEAARVEKEQFLKDRPDWSYYSLPICHWPMLSSPQELASILMDIAKK